MFAMIKTDNEYLHAMLGMTSEMADVDIMEKWFSL